jgi:hypothetical protein
LEEDTRIILTGIEPTIRALKEFDKKAVAKFNKIVNTELNNAEGAAHRLVDSIQSRTTNTPMRNWRPTAAVSGRTWGGAGWPAWDPNTIKAGITVSKAQRRTRKDYTTNAGALLNTSDAGKVFELSGRNKKSGSFIERLNWFGKASRLVWKVVDKERPRIEKVVEKALEEAKRELQTHLDSAGKVD